MHDIRNIEDIKTLINSFYDKIRKDDLLADIFNHIIQDNWPKHLEKMYRFWQTVLLSEHTYTGSPFVPHAKMQIEREHFSKWIELFTNTVDENFKGPKASEAIWRAKKMAEMFQIKLNYYKNENVKTLF